MRRNILLLAFVFLCGAFADGQATNCSYYNKITYPPVFWDPSNTVGHKPGGSHSWLSSSVGVCSYASVGEQNCSTTSYSYGSVSGSDTGWLTITNPLVNHYVGQTASGGTSFALGGGIATSAVTVCGSDRTGVRHRVGESVYQSDRV